MRQAGWGIAHIACNAWRVTNRGSRLSLYRLSLLTYRVSFYASVIVVAYDVPRSSVTCRVLAVSSVACRVLPVNMSLVTRGVPSATCLLLVLILACRASADGCQVSHPSIVRYSAVGGAVVNIRPKVCDLHSAV